MKVAWLTPVLALALSVGIQAQDAPKKGDCCGSETKAQDKCCGAAGLMCPKEGKCEGKCREICDRVGATLKAVQTRTVELMKKDAGCECQCTGGKCTEKACNSCDVIKAKVFKPILTERVNARFKTLDKAVKHTVTDDKGKSSEVACTFLTGDPCKTCVNEMADASWKKLKEMFSAKESK